MAKKQLRNYVFNPGSSGSGYIKVLDKILHNQLLIITNITKNVVLYNFADSEKQISVSFSADFDSDFPSASETSNGVTTLTFLFDTSDFDSTDEIQIFIDVDEVRFRPYNFGTDAIERMRVATPQSMLDADFEYGIQPTKWQTIDMMRGYPSIYEVPGTDLQVTSITSDASSGTSGVGQSLITVVTTEPHEYTVGTAVRIIGVDDRVSGGSRAQGSFTVHSVISTTSFTYYAKGKVGTTSGVSLYTSYIQLRKGGFYTGSQIGNPNLTVLTNGSNGSFSSRFNTPAASNRISYVGVSTFAIGSPLTGSNIPQGAQVTGISTLTGNVSFKENVTAPASQLVVNESSLLEVGSALDDGSGSATFVTNIDGDTLSLSSPYQVNASGSDNNVGIFSGTKLGWGSGSNALFQVNRQNGAYFVGLSNVTKTATGTASSTYIVLSPNITGIVPGQNVTGTGVGAGATVVGYVGISTIVVSVPNSGTVTGTLSFNNYGQNYNVNDILQIDGNFLGGVDGINDLRIKVANTGGGGFISSISTNKNILITNQAQLSTGQFLVGGTSLLLNPTVGGVDYITAVSTPDFAFGTGDFTIDMHIYRNRVGVSEVLFDMRNSVSDSSPNLRLNTSNQVEFYVGATGIVTSLSPVAAGGWNHIAVTRQSGTVKIFVNGQDEGSGVDSTSMPQRNVNIGADYLGATGFYGYIDNARIRTGYAKYTSTFTPYSFFTNTDQYTTLLLRFIGPNASTDIYDESYGRAIPSNFSYQINPVGGTGSGSLFNIFRQGGGSPSYAVTLLDGGSGYTNNDTLTIDGSLLGGLSVLNDLTLTVSSETGGVINAVTQSGTAASGNRNYSAITGKNSGSGATFSLVKSSGSYLVSIASSGTGYYPGYDILVSGADLGGTSPANDATVTIESVGEDEESQNLPIGTVVSATVTGTPVNTDTFDFYGSASMSEVTTGIVPQNTNVTFSSIAKIQASIPNHGLVPGDTIFTNITSNGINHALAGGPFIVEETPSLNLFNYTARAAGNINTGTQLTGIVYPRPDCFYIHRPFDGGVQLGTGGPSHGAQAVRQSKKYLRYQSGKGIMYTTGTLFAPSYDLRSVYSNGLAVGSVITVITDDTEHGLQVGAEIALNDIKTSGYNNHYIVNSIINESTFTVLALQELSATTAVLGVQAQVSLYKWKGATVRAGAFDDQNGIFWQYDGINLSVGYRSGTYQLAGVISASPDTNIIIGTNTRFQDQLIVGDRIIIRGMTHVVTKIDSQTQIAVNPDYRGVSPVTGAKCALVNETIFPQSSWNIDKADGTGPSGYNILINKMQMIGFQYTWYGAGFIDWMLRGPNGDYLFVHRLKNNNRNTEAFMRSGNLPVRYEVINEGAKSVLATSVGAASTTLQLSDASLYPNAGTIYVDNELISYTNKSQNTLGGLTRAATFSNFASGSQRSYSAGSAASHTQGTGAILISNTATPVISHWGSAFLTDGLFDSDRGYIFNYQAVNFPISSVKDTAFLIRLSPAVSNALTGDLGERELINRAQLLLQGIDFTPTGGGNNDSVVIEGILNPQNFPSDPSQVSWFGLNSAGNGGQPSFAQIAKGDSVVWVGAVSPVTASNSITQNFRTTYVLFNRSATSSVKIGMSVSATGLPGGTTVVGFFNYNSTNWYIQLSQSIRPGNSGSSSFTFSSPVSALPGETVFSFVASGQGQSSFDLKDLKELNNTPIGGRGTFPNGPDVLAINVYGTGTGTFNGSIVLRWGEAQA
jgi:hypothetical protein